MQTMNTMTTTNTNTIQPNMTTNTDDLNSIAKLEALGYKGPDVSLDISLTEYDLVWLVGATETVFIYSIGHGRFDRCTLSNDVIVRTEWNWVDFDALCTFTGLDKDEFFAMPLPFIVFDLLNEYGYENVFGSSYWEGFAIDCD